MPNDEPAVDHRALGAAINGATWELLGAQSLGADQLDELLERAHASAYHWRQATEPGAIERARSAWMLARCYTVAGQADLALRYAESCAALTSASTGAVDFDRAYAHEATARANALAGNLDIAARSRAAAAEVAIVDADDRKILEGDLAAGPWFDLA